MLCVIVMLIGRVNSVNNHTCELQKLSLGEKPLPWAGHFE